MSQKKQQYFGGGGGGNSGNNQHHHQQQQQQQQQSSNSKESDEVDKDTVLRHVLHITSPLNAKQREDALTELSTRREKVADLAPILWNSFGTVTALLQEIISVYPLLSPAKLDQDESNRVCSALALLQCLAAHPETRLPFLRASIPLYVYPFLGTVNKQKSFEYLRLTSLGVIGALVKSDDSEVITFLLQTEIIPLCLQIMDHGRELSKTVSTFILQKILLDDQGLQYICLMYDRFFAVSTVLNNMITALTKEPETNTGRLLKHIIRCYLRLCDNPKAREALKQGLPEQLRDPKFVSPLKDDQTSQTWLIQLLKVTS